MIQFNNKPPKKLVVKNLKNKPRIPEEYEALSMARIGSTIDAVFSEAPLPYGHEEIYKTVEALCKFGLGSNVYRLLYEKCEAEALSSANQLIKETLGSMEDVEYLKKFDFAWSKFQRNYSLLESIFLYLDRVFIVNGVTVDREAEHVRIHRFGINFFRSYFLMQRHCSCRNSVENSGMALAKRLIDCVNSLRAASVEAGELFEMVGRLIGMLRALEEYVQNDLDFEKLMLQSTVSFYEHESLTKIESDFKAQGLAGVPRYLLYASARLDYENRSISSLLAPSSKDRLISGVQDALITSRLNFVFPSPVGSSLLSMFEHKDVSSMALLYDLINRVFSIETLSREWASFVKSYGARLVAQENERRLMERIIHFKTQVDGLIQDCFQFHPMIQGTLKDAFESFMNSSGDRVAELLALHIHHRFQRLDSEGIESFMSMVLLMFRYLHRKEAFDAFYKRTLAHRLLFSPSLSGEMMSVERRFVSKLRDECGGGFVSRMEIMLKDIETSVELSRSFKASVQNAGGGGIASVTTMTVVSSLWPSPVAPEHQKLNGGVSLPSELLRLETGFAEFFTNQRKNSSIKWQEALGSCVMRSNYSIGKVDLILSIPQALVLLQFNGKSEISLNKLSESLKMDRSEVQETINSLSTAKYPILLLVGADAVKFNENFKWAEGVKRIPLNALQSPFLSIEDIFDENDPNSSVFGMASTSSSLTATPQLTAAALAAGMATSVIVDRQYQVDALLIRRMKAIGRSLRKDLVNFALANLKNIAISAADVDGRIDSLLDKEFLQLHDAGSTVSYLP